MENGCELFEIKFKSHYKDYDESVITDQRLLRRSHQR